MASAAAAEESRKAEDEARRALTRQTTLDVIAGGGARSAEDRAALVALVRQVVREELALLGVAAPASANAAEDALRGAEAARAEVGAAEGSGARGEAGTGSRLHLPAGKEGRRGARDGAAGTIILGPASAVVDKH